MVYSACLRKIGLTLTSLGLLGVSSVAFTLRPLPAIAQSNPATASGMQRLAQMFSPDIQSTINACSEKGKVNLAAGASTNGAVICANGRPDPDVSFTEYVDTVSDVLAASSLVGFRTVMTTNPQVTPTMLQAFLASSQGQETLYTAIESAITRSQLLPSDSTESTSILAGEVVSRLLPAVNDAGGLVNLLGTTEQYQQVVSQFCTPPGMSIESAQELVPDLNSVQLYAICIEESGVTQDAAEQLRTTN